MSSSKILANATHANSLTGLSESGRRSDASSASSGRRTAARTNLANHGTTRGVMWIAKINLVSVRDPDSLPREAPYGSPTSTWCRFADRPTWGRLADHDVAAVDLVADSATMYIHHMASMVRKQVYLTVEQDRLLRRAAKKHRRTEAEIIRQALDRTLGNPASDDPARDPIWGLVAIADGGDDLSELSERIDDVLYARRKG